MCFCCRVKEQPAKNEELASKRHFSPKIYLKLLSKKRRISGKTKHSCCSLTSQVILFGYSLRRQLIFFPFQRHLMVRDNQWEKSRVGEIGFEMRVLRSQDDKRRISESLGSTFGSWNEKFFLSRSSFGSSWQVKENGHSSLMHTWELIELLCMSLRIRWLRECNDLIMMMMEKEKVCKLRDDDEKGDSKRECKTKRQSGDCDGIIETSEKGIIAESQGVFTASSSLLLSWRRNNKTRRWWLS